MDPRLMVRLHSLYRNNASQLHALFLQLDCEEWDLAQWVASIVSSRQFVMVEKSG
jgi:hypothetical protein